MKNGTRLAALGGVVLAGALALSACGSDDNGSSATGSGGGSDSACGSGTLNAAGSTAQANAITEWTKDFASQCASVHINYNANGSGAGVESFSNGQAAFAGSDSALTPDQQPAADKRCAGGKAIDLPMVVGPVAIVYNVDGVTNLNLTGPTVAGIFDGAIKTWDDAKIKADNPGVKLPSTKITTLHRSDSSGTTANFSSYLTAAGGGAWTTADSSGGKVWTAKGGLGEKGSALIASTLKTTAGSIGYVEMSYATNGNLNTASINGVKLSTDSAAQTVGTAQVVGTAPDLSLKIDYATKEQGAYPIVLVTYEIACTKGLSADQGKAVKSFLTYTSSAAGQQVLSQLGYAPLPSAVLTKVQQTVASLS